MKNLLLSAAIGDIAGSVYESRQRATKDYRAVKVFAPYAHITDDTICTYACAEAFVERLDMSQNLHSRGRLHLGSGYGSRFRGWLLSQDPKPYYSYANGSAMRASSAGWLATSEGECVELATQIALPTHDHPDGIKGAVATALAIYYLKVGKSKEDVRTLVLGKYYPEWLDRHYSDIHATYQFDVSCEGTVPAAVLCFLASEDYLDCIKLAIALAGDADTLAATAGPMAYAYFRELPEDLVQIARDILPSWMLRVNDAFDELCSRREE